MHRLLVNMVWNARNYIVVIFTVTLTASYFWPLFLLVFPPAFMLQRQQSSATVGKLWGLGQMGCILVNLYFYGFLPGLVTTTLCVLIVIGHAILTPYTDDALKLVDSLLQQTCGEELPPPRTPVISFVPNIPIPPLKSLQLGQSMAPSNDSLRPLNVDAAFVSSVSGRPGDVRSPPTSPRRSVERKSSEVWTLERNSSRKGLFDEDAADDAARAVTATKSSFDVVLQKKNSRKRVFA